MNNEMQTFGAFFSEQFISEVSWIYFLAKRPSSKVEQQTVKSYCYYDKDEF